MTVMGIDKLEARLFDLKQDINDTIIDWCRGCLESPFKVDIKEFDRNYTLLNSMLPLNTDINKSINMFLSVAKQGIDLNISYKKLLSEYVVVKNE